MRLGGPIALSATIILCYLLTWVLPIGVSLYYQEYTQAWSFGITSIVLSLVLMLFRIVSNKSQLRAIDGFLVVSISWLGISLISSIPFYLSSLSPTFMDSWFESVSAITTTGIEVLGDVELWPRGLLCV